jgi:hypothetical protein
MARQRLFKIGGGDEGIAEGEPVNSSVDAPAASRVS